MRVYKYLLIVSFLLFQTLNSKYRLVNFLSIKSTQSNTKTSLMKTVHSLGGFYSMKMLFYKTLAITDHDQEITNIN